MPGTHTALPSQHMSLRGLNDKVVIVTGAVLSVDGGLVVGT